MKVKHLKRCLMAGLLACLAPAAHGAANPAAGDHPAARARAAVLPTPFATPHGMPPAQAFATPPGQSHARPQGQGKDFWSQSAAASPTPPARGSKLLPAAALSGAEAARQLDAWSRELSYCQAQVEAMLAAHQGEWSQFSPEENARCRKLLTRWRQAQLTLAALLEKPEPSPSRP